MIHRPAARVLAGILNPLPISPNAVTVLSLVPAAAAALLFAGGSQVAAAAGLAGFYLWALLDHTDGELARVRKQTSAFGKKLDDFCDAAASNLMLIGIFAGLLSRTPENDSPILVAAFIAGLVMNAAGGELVTRAKRRYREDAVRSTRVDRAAFRKQKILDHFTGREPFYILIGLFVAALGARQAWAAGMAAFLIAGIYLSGLGALAAWFGMTRKQRADLF